MLGTRPEVISNPITVRWPLGRAVLRRPPLTRHSPRPPIDAFPRPEDVPPVPGPDKMPSPLIRPLPPPPEEGK